MVGAKIVKTALGYVGQEETPNNSGFRNAEFQGLMESVGWKKSEAWCTYFAELVWKTASVFSPQEFEELNRLFSGSAVQTWARFSKAKGWVCSKVAVPGAIAIWQHYKEGIASWTGHAAIVVAETVENFSTVEGNTNDVGGREGYIVAKKTRKYTFAADDGLRLIGFIHPVKKEA